MQIFSVWLYQAFSQKLPYKYKTLRYQSYKIMLFRPYIIFVNFRDFPTNSLKPELLRCLKLVAVSKLTEELFLYEDNL